MRHLFIINPVAGKGRTLKVVPEIESYCSSHGLKYDIYITKYPGHATEIAKEQSALHTLRIYSVGGDGTLNEVLNGMAGSGSSLAVIPCGSGNDFIRSIVGKKIPDDILKLTIEGVEHPIDYSRVNNQYFINIASLGFDAKVAHQTCHFKKLPLISGEMAYVFGILSTILICENNYMEVIIDGEKKSGRMLLIAVGIGRYYGGGMYALPDAMIDDGLYDICLVEAMSRFEILRLFPKYMKGLHRTIKGVNMYRAKKIEIIPDKPIPLNRDGEIVMADKAVFEIYHKALPFVFPAAGTVQPLAAGISPAFTTKPEEAPPSPP